MPARLSSHAADLAQRERNELIGRIASGLAHELNGPIGIALGFTELAKELLEKTGRSGLDPVGVSTLKEYLALIEGAGVRGRTLARRISAFSRMVPGAIGGFDLAEALDEAAYLANPAVKGAGIEVVRVRGASGAAPVRGDRALCVQTFVRIFLSSPEALPGGGSVLWDATPDLPKDKSVVKFVLGAEPWGTARSAAWSVPGDIVEAFARQGGSIGPAVSRWVGVRSVGDPPAAPAWELPGWLPAADAAAEDASPDAGNGTVTATAASERPVRGHAGGRRGAGK